MTRRTFKTGFGEFCWAFTIFLNMSSNDLLGGYYYFLKIGFGDFF